MKIKKSIIAIALTSSCISTAQAEQFMTMEDKFPFIPLMNDVSIMNEAVGQSGYDVSEVYPYINEAYVKGNISKKELIFSMEQQEKLLNWMKKNPNPRYIIVNVPAYKILVLTSMTNSIGDFKNYMVEWESRVVVGSPYHKTPLNPMKIVSLKYNPTWTPTYNIMKRNARTQDGEWNWGWLEGHDLKPFLRSTREPLSWVEAKSLPLNQLLLIQPSGESNALGKIKFETTSSQNIYLHDTNEKWFFDETDRARSSGCIRVENPNHLASILSYREQSYIENNIDKGRMYWEPIEKTPVYLMYDIIDYNKDYLTLMEDPYNIYEKYNAENSSYEIEN